MIFIPQAESVLLDFAGIESIQPSGHMREVKNHVAFFVKLRFFQIRGGIAISAAVNVPQSSGGQPFSQNDIGSGAVVNAIAESAVNGRHNGNTGDISGTAALGIPDDAPARVNGFSLCPKKLAIQLNGQPGSFFTGFGTELFHYPFKTLFISSTLLRAGVGASLIPQNSPDAAALRANHFDHGAVQIAVFLRIPPGERRTAQRSLKQSDGISQFPMKSFGKGEIRGSAGIGAFLIDGMNGIGGVVHGVCSQIPPHTVAEEMDA